MSIIRNFFRADGACIRKFIFNLGFKGMRGFSRFQKRKAAGDLFPAFHFISLTNKCNLNCRGCWVTQHPESNLNIEAVHSVIDQSKKKGSYFFGLLGGEPLLYKPILEILDKHSDAYFQLFTNGHLLTPGVCEKLRRRANVSPLISFEGDEMVADIRRGGKEVYNHTVTAIKNSVAAGLITGIAVSVCQSNIDFALSDRFIEMLHASGVVYLWYYIYRPSGEQPGYDLALNTEQINRLRRFLVEKRGKVPLVLIDSYWDADGRPFCPAAAGLSHHINPAGYVEPCPVLQLSSFNIYQSNLTEKYKTDNFLADFRQTIPNHTAGCILMDKPSEICNYADKYGLENTSGRSDYFDKLKQYPSVPCHASAEVMREKNFFYRIAKKRAFFGLGAYG